MKLDDKKSFLGKIIPSEESLFSAINDIYHLRERTQGQRRWPFKSLVAKIFPFLYPHKKQAKFFFLILGMMSRLARADGEVSIAEKSSIKEFISEELHLSEKEQKLAFKILKQSSKSKRKFEDFAREYYWTFRSNEAMLESAIDLLISLGHADGHFDDDEKQLVADAAHAFRFKKKQLRKVEENWRHRRERMLHEQAGRYTENSKAHREKAIRDKQPQKATENCYKILGCTPDDSLAEIKTHYRKLAKKYHPDSLQASGMPAGFIQRAEKKFILIQEAYERVLRERES